MPWWDQNPGVWQREQQALTAEGITFQVQARPKTEGRLSLDITMQLEDQPLRLVAHYPFNYPYAPPMVIAPALNLARHQTPGTKQLCLLRNGGEAWQPATDSLATLLRAQLPEIFAAQPGGPMEHEQGQEAEPITAFLQPEEFSFVGFPAFDLAPLPQRGTFKIGLSSARPLRGTVLEVFDVNGIRLFASEARAGKDFQPQAVVTGRWVRLPGRPDIGDAKDFFQRASAQDSTLERPNWQTLPNGNRLEVLALLFPDELVFGQQTGNAVVVSKLKVASKGHTGSIDTRLHRVELESRANYFQRDPSAAGLQKGCVSLVGTGSIGSPAAKLLAQGGIGELRMFDHDILDAGNAIRWELGREYAGHPKVFALQRVLAESFPYTKVVGSRLRIGEARPDHAPELVEAYGQLFRKVSCVFDASAAVPVSNYLADTARAHGIPFVWMYATPGAWGGLVGRAGPTPSDFCWMCHLYYFDDPPAERKVEPPPSAPEEDIQPVGCLDPTFVGSQVDLVEVSLMGTRAVVDAVLRQTGAQEGSRYDWNLAVLELRDKNGNPQLPKWTPYRLPPHAKCPHH